MDDGVVVDDAEPEMVGLPTPVRVLVTGVLGRDDIEELIEGDRAGHDVPPGLLTQRRHDGLALLQTLPDLLDEPREQPRGGFADHREPAVGGGGEHLLQQVGGQLERLDERGGVEAVVRRLLHALHHARVHPGGLEAA